MITMKTRVSSSYGLTTVLVVVLFVISTLKESESAPKRVPTLSKFDLSLPWLANRTTFEYEGPTNYNSLSRMLSKQAYNNWVTIFFFNKAVIRWTLNCLYSYIKFGKSKSYIVAATDDASLAVCIKYRLPCFNASYILGKEGSSLASEIMLLNSKNYLSVVWGKILLLQEVLQLGYNVHFSDVDVVYLRPIWPSYRLLFNRYRVDAVFMKETVLREAPLDPLGLGGWRVLLQKNIKGSSSENDHERVSHYLMDHQAPSSSHQTYSHARNLRLSSESSTSESLHPKHQTEAISLKQKVDRALSQLWDAGVASRWGRTLFQANWNDPQPPLFKSRTEDMEVGAIGAITLFNTGVYAMRSNSRSIKLVAKWLATNNWTLHDQAMLNSLAFKDYMVCSSPATCQSAKKMGWPVIFRHASQFGIHGVCPHKFDAPCGWDNSEMAKGRVLQKYKLWLVDADGWPLYNEDLSSAAHPFLPCQGAAWTGDVWGPGAATAGTGGEGNKQALKTGADADF